MLEVSEPADTIADDVKMFNVASPYCTVRDIWESKWTFLHGRAQEKIGFHGLSGQLGSVWVTVSLGYHFWESTSLHVTENKWENVILETGVWIIYIHWFAWNCWICCCACYWFFSVILKDCGSLLQDLDISFQLFLLQILACVKPI